MPIEQLTPMRQIEDALARMIENRQAVIIRKLTDIGEQSVAQARLRGSYTDQTSNLRSSVGYVIARDGKIVSQSNFDQLPPKVAPKAGEKNDGGEQGLQFARKIVAEKFPKGIVFIAVAGMKYASAVASGRRKTRNGKRYNVRAHDVLDSAEDLAIRLARDLDNQFK